MKKRFILALTAIASLMANAASIGCIVAFIDEYNEKQKAAK